MNFQARTPSHWRYGFMHCKAAIDGLLQSAHLHVVQRGYGAGCDLMDDRNAVAVGHAVSAIATACRTAEVWGVGGLGAIVIPEFITKYW